MKKIMNKAENFVPEMLEGICLAHSDQLTYVGDDVHCIVKTNIKENKVGIATGGGSGHLPLFLGYVGDGMLDGCSVGDVFQSPSSEQMLAVTKAIDSGSGVLYIYGNYNGDIFNFDTAAEMADFEEDISVESVITGDDIASAAPVKPGEKNKRRGVAGIFFVFKCAGAAADEMMSLQEVRKVAEDACTNVRTMGVALSACIVPRLGKATFEIKDDEMDIGMGIHGEPGISKTKLKSANEIVDQMLLPIIEDLQCVSGDEVCVLINGLGGTPLEEQYIMYRRVHHILSEKNISVYKVFIGEYATSMEMAGASISLLKLNNELKRLVSAPANTPFIKCL